MSNATFSPLPNAPYKGNKFHHTKRVEIFAENLLMDVCRELLGKQISTVDRGLQDRGVDWLLQLASGDVRIEMKTEMFDRNSFQELLQLVIVSPFDESSDRTYQFGGVQKCQSDLYLLMNMVSGYLILVERRPWAQHALEWAITELEHRRLTMSAVINLQEREVSPDRIISRINRVAYGVPVENARLVLECRRAERFVQVFDMRERLMSQPNYTEELAKLRNGAANESSMKWAREALTRGAPDYENMTRQFGMLPLSELPNVLLNLPPLAENSREFVREGGEFLMVCAQDESKTSQRLRLSSRALPYRPYDDEVGDYYGGGIRQFTPPRCPPPEREKRQVVVMREADRNKP
jgi:hypothetical protein